MTTISVPGPARQSFNKNRPLSDLLKQQLKHFHHVEARLAPDRRGNFTARDVATPEGASRYIAYMTNMLRGLPAEQPQAAPGPALVRSTRPSPPTGLAIAAVAEAESPSGNAKKRSGPRKKALPPENPPDASVNSEKKP